MRAYTDKFVVRPDGIYRIEGSYYPGGEWEEREVLWVPKDVLIQALVEWVPRETLMSALLEWQGNDKKESETNGRCKRSRQARKTGRNTIETP